MQRDFSIPTERLKSSSFVLAAVLAALLPANMLRAEAAGFTDCDQQSAAYFFDSSNLNVALTSAFPGFPSARFVGTGSSPDPLNPVLIQDVNSPGYSISGFHPVTGVAAEATVEIDNSIFDRNYFVNFSFQIWSESPITGPMTLMEYEGDGQYIRMSAYAPAAGSLFERIHVEYSTPTGPGEIWFDYPYSAGPYQAYGPVPPGATLTGRNGVVVSVHGERVFVRMTGPFSVGGDTIMDPHWNYSTDVELTGFGSNVALYPDKYMVYGNASAGGSPVDGYIDNIRLWGCLPETNTPTPTHTDTYTHTHTFTHTFTDTPTQTPTHTHTDTHTFTHTHTDTYTNTHTFTDTPTFTHTYTDTDTPTFTHTDTPTHTPTHTPTPYPCMEPAAPDCAETWESYSLGDVPSDQWIVDGNTGATIETNPYTGSKSLRFLPVGGEGKVTLYDQELTEVDIQAEVSVFDPAGRGVLQAHTPLGELYNGYYFVVIPYQTNGVAIGRRWGVNGEYNLNLGYTAGYFPASDCDVFRMRLVVKDGLIQAYLNDDLVLSNTDSFFTSGYAGMQTYSVFAWYDNVSINEEMCATPTPTPTFTYSDTPTHTPTHTPTPYPCMDPAAPDCAETWESYSLGDVPSDQWIVDGNTGATIETNPYTGSKSLRFLPVGGEGKVALYDKELTSVDIQAEVSVFDPAGRGVLQAHTPLGQLYNGYYFVVIPYQTNGVAIGRRWGVNGEYNLNLGYTAGYFPASDCDVFRMRLVVENGVVQGYLNDQLVVSANDSFFTSGYAGMQTYSVFAWYDNVSINEEMCRRDVTLNKTQDKNDMVGPGDIITYSLKFSYSGLDDPSGNYLADHIPPFTQYVPGSVTITGANFDVTTALWTLPSGTDTQGQPLIAEFPVLKDGDSGVMSFQVQVMGDVLDPNRSGPEGGILFESDFQTYPVGEDPWQYDTANGNDLTWSTTGSTEIVNLSGNKVLRLNGRRVSSVMQNPQAPVTMETRFWPDGSAIQGVIHFGMVTVHYTGNELLVTDSGNPGNPYSVAVSQGQEHRIVVMMNAERSWRVVVYNAAGAVIDDRTTAGVENWNSPFNGFDHVGTPRFEYGGAGNNAMIDDVAVYRAIGNKATFEVNWNNPQHQINSVARQSSAALVPVLRDEISSPKPVKPSSSLAKSQIPDDVVAPGQAITYRLDFAYDGDLDPLGNFIQDFIPQFTQYEAGSARIINANFDPNTAVISEPQGPDTEQKELRVDFPQLAGGDRGTLEYVVRVMEDANDPGRVGYPGGLLFHEDFERYPLDADPWRYDKDNGDPQKWGTNGDSHVVDLNGDHALSFHHEDVWTTTLGAGAPTTGELVFVVDGRSEKDTLRVNSVTIEVNANVLTIPVYFAGANNDDTLLVTPGMEYTLRVVQSSRTHRIIILNDQMQPLYDRTSYPGFDSYRTPWGGGGGQFYFSSKARSGTMLVDDVAMYRAVVNEAVFQVNWNGGQTDTRVLATQSAASAVPIVNPGPPPPPPAFSVTGLMDGATASSRWGKLYPNLAVKNTGSDPLDFGSLELRFWYNRDQVSNGQKVLKFNSTYNGTNIKSQLTGVLVNTTLGGQTDYLSVTFDPSLGQLAPGEQAQANFRIDVLDSSEYYDTSNDWSYQGRTSGHVANNHVTVYYNGDLVWGVQPDGSSAGPSMSALGDDSEKQEGWIPQDQELIVAPNPVGGDEASVYFRADGSESLTLVIFDLEGRPVASVDLGRPHRGEHQRQVDLKGWAPGTYFFALRSQGRSGHRTKAIFKVAVIH